MPSHAVPPCLPRSDLLGNLAAVNAPLKVNQVDDADRRTAEAYAAENHATANEIKQRYAATGDLNCGGGKSQANVTLIGNVITTTAHSIVGDNQCVDLKKKPPCTFTVEVEGQRIEYQTTEVTASGKACGSLNKSKNGRDWAVMKLNKMVDSRVKPYQIDPEWSLGARPNTPVTAVGKSIDWPDSKSKDLFNHPKHYGNCVTKQLGSGWIDTNCDSSAGSSGGPLLKRDTNAPILVGVHESTTTGGDECPPPNSAKRSGPYSQCWASVSTILKGSFSDAVIKAAEESGYIYND